MTSPTDQANSESDSKSFTDLPQTSQGDHLPDQPSSDPSPQEASAANDPAPEAATIGKEEDTDSEKAQQEFKLQYRSSFYSLFVSLMSLVFLLFFLFLFVFCLDSLVVSQ